jgi:C-terminal processing protease CtpA/Prc
MAETGFKKENLRRLDRLPTDKPNFLAIATMAMKYARRDPSVLLVSEGVGPQRWHGRIVILINEHTISAGEMVAAFAKENNLATLVGTETAGRLIPGSGFRIGFGYMLIMPKAAYLTWHGRRFEGHGIDPDHAAGWSPSEFMNERDGVLSRAVKLATLL